MHYNYDVCYVHNGTSVTIIKSLSTAKTLCLPTDHSRLWKQIHSWPSADPCLWSCQQIHSVPIYQSTVNWTTSVFVNCFTCVYCNRFYKYFLSTDLCIYLCGRTHFALRLTLSLHSSNSAPQPFCLCPLAPLQDSPIDFIIHFCLCQLFLTWLSQLMYFSLQTDDSVSVSWPVMILNLTPAFFHKNWRSIVCLFLQLALLWPANFQQTQSCSISIFQQPAVATI